MSDKVVRIELGDGKYTYVHDPVTGRQEALRYGQKWRDLVGDNFVYLLAQKVLEAEAKAKAFDMLSFGEFVVHANGVPAFSVKVTELEGQTEGGGNETGA